ncbi:MAG TPA: DinB family protein [Candidatus Acidoferrum sp.]|nr:DinB family protein [Candidatus Acidoferrum sp.]
MKELGEQLVETVRKAEKKLRQITAIESEKPVLRGGWSTKQVMGHLIDSASNNHQRFVRAMVQPSLDFPGYDQVGCVRVEASQQADWEMLVSLWATYNIYLAHVIAQIPESKLATPCKIGDDRPVTLEFLARDYWVHLVHHLDQII